ncbi:MAG: hypothetical protein AAF497_07670, partial [Planctomycetota bacterium]
KANRRRKSPGAGAGNSFSLLMLLFESDFWWEWATRNSEPNRWWLVRPAFPPGDLRRRFAGCANVHRTDHRLATVATF